MTIIDEAIISGFIGKIISDCIDITKIQIKEADKNRKSKHQNLQMRIYQVIIDAINVISYNEYKDQEALYDTAEDLLNGFKNRNSNRIDVVKHSLPMLIPDVNNSKCEEFIGVLRTEISKECNFDLYKEILIMLLEKTAVYNQNELQQIKEQLYCITQKLDENSKAKEDNTYDRPKSRTQEYADKWNKNMFLNNFSEWDENVGVNVKLKDVLYKDEHLPRYIWENNKKKFDDLNTFLAKYMEKNNENKMLLILGQPGIGKSTLITWLTVKFSEQAKDILVYKFADDLKSIDWKQSNISKEILNVLNLSKDDLNGKTLILDGFDEVSIEANRRRDILDNLYGEWIYRKNIKNISLVITCRENYIQGFERVKCNYITLRAWSKKQIKSFCDTFKTKTNNIISEDTINKLLKNREIMGIPLILYMVLALNISIEKEGSVVDVYDKVFSLEGGIYDRCIDNKNFADKHRISEVKKQIHQISRDIAIRMFENNSEEASVSQKEYVNICDQVMSKVVTENVELEQDFKIGSYFRLIKHCEGVETEELTFVHRTIYEYFVAETIYSSIENAMIELSEESQKELAENIAMYLKQGEIDNTIGEYLNYKILKLYKKLNVQKQILFYQWWEKAVEKMMQKGMFYYLKTALSYENILAKETRCFNNLIEILRLLINTSKKDYILEEADQILLMRYIRHSLIECRIFYLGDMEIDNTEPTCEGYVLDLSKLNLIKANLEMNNLSAVDLGETNLKYSNLKKTNLKMANLKKADLEGADLRGVELEGAHLRGTKLNQSRWYISDVIKALSQLKTSEFKYIIVEDENGNGRSRWYKAKLLLKFKNS